MRIPHDTFVLVADGRKMLFFRNEGDADHPNLELIRQGYRPNPATHDQASDTAGRASNTTARRGGSFEEADFHQIEEDRFAAGTAEMLKKRAMAGEFEHLLVVAPPRTLGELRKHYHVEVSRRLTGEIDKDLTGHSIDRIEKIIGDTEPADAD